MVCKYAVVVLLGLLISSCAQVGQISGGDVDKFAPKPIAENMVPLNESTNFQANTVEIPFNEYFRLVNPTQNIRMVPPHATVTASVRKKVLTLTWNDTLEANTTYAIYLNNAIKDLNEANDTVIQYVFSTGAILDTLSYSVPVIDAWTNKAMDDCVVALFEPTTNKLVSLAKPKKGVASLNYLRSGDYRLVAFKDENNDLELQDYEMLGFPESDIITINESWFDSVPLRLFTPRKEPKISSVRFIPPCTFVVSATRPIVLDTDSLHPNLNAQEQPALTLNGALLKPFELNPISEDSVLVYFNDPEAKTVQFTYQYGEAIDTLNFRFKPKQQEGKIVIRTKKSGLTSPKEKITFTVNGRISSIDKSKIKITNSQDSTEITEFTVDWSVSELFLELNREGLESIKIEFDSSAVLTNCGSSEAAVKEITLNSEGDYGDLNVDVSGYQEPIIIELLQRKNVVKSIAVSDDSSPVLFDEIFPGEYYFRVIRDANENGKWDVGEYSTLTQPELIDEYSKKTKVRANWSIDVTLTPIK